MAGEGTLVVKGLTPMIRGFHRLDKDVSGEMKNELRKLALPVAELAKATARAKGLVGESGKLVSSIRPFATQKGAGIRESATRKGFPYPAVYEYGGRSPSVMGGEGVGPRSFLAPAVVASAPIVEAGLSKWLEGLLEGVDRI